MASYYCCSLLLMAIIFQCTNAYDESDAVQEGYDDPPLIEEESDDLDIETRVERIVYSWHGLSDGERNNFKMQVEEKETNYNAAEEDYEEEDYDDVETQGKTSINKDLKIYSYYSRMLYYPTIEWNLDKTPDSKRYWIGVFKVGSSNKDYLSFKWIGKVAQGADKNMKLKVKTTSKANTRYDRFELRIFKGDRRLPATSNILNGVVHAPPLKMYTKPKIQEEKFSRETKLDAFL